MPRYKSKPQTAGRDAENIYCAQAEFRYRIRRFLRSSEKLARRAGIHPQQYLLMLAIKGMPVEKRANIRNLAERLQLEHHSTVELVDRTERCGFVARLRELSDRRQVIVQLTSTGERLLKRLSTQHRAELRSEAPELVRALHELTRWKKSGDEQ